MIESILYKSIYLISKQALQVIFKKWNNEYFIRIPHTRAIYKISQG